MTFKPLFLAAALSLAAITTASALTVTFGGQVNPALAPNVTPPVYNLVNSQIVHAGTHSSLNGWDPYGSTDTTHSWLDIADGGSAWAHVNGVKGLDIVWGSPNNVPDPGNVLDFYNGNNLVATYSATDFINSFGTQNTPSPGYIAKFTGDFTNVKFVENGGGNFEVGFAAPEMSTWLMLITGFIGLFVASSINKRKPLPTI